MKSFNFEKNLPHQTQAVAATMAAFEGLEIQTATVVEKQYINPTILLKKPSGKFQENVQFLQKENGIEAKAKAESNIIDIMMETGTGKTYTYTKTIFELNKHFGIFKFIVVVPTLSIKAGTIDFLKSESSREHFKEQYSKSIHLHIVESQKNNKSKKAYIPQAISNFVNAGSFAQDKIQVMLINAGMINSETLQNSFDKGLFDKYTVPFEAIAAVNPFLIIDEPHKFTQGSKTWENIQKMKPQFILRYGATFPDTPKEKIKVKDYHNLVYTLTSVDAFNKNLVKGIIGHIAEFETGKNAVVKFVDSDGKEASFELSENGNKKTFKMVKNGSFAHIHPQMTDLFVENINKSVLVLSNGLEMKKGDKINPYSYAQTLQEMMMQKAIKHHFELEKQLLTREVRIKPLTLFFIDNIEEYRNPNGYIRNTVEQLIKAEIIALLKTEKDIFYKDYLEKTLADLSKTHAGYFSKDNTEKDEVIEKEINEILHDKQAMLDLANTRRFIFSKWTLREGWDNPNVFQICKLRSSGSEISKLQEVGRGLRLPVNEYGNRVKEEQFYLNYFVDFTESDFVDKLVNEINEKSGAISSEKVPEKLHDNMIRKICELYKTNEDDLLTLLDEKNLITRTNSFKRGGFEYIKQHYPRIFEGVNSNKVRKATDTKKKMNIRTEKYQELKELWEKLNEKVILEYNFENEEAFQSLFTAFLTENENQFTPEGFREMEKKLAFEAGKAIIKEDESAYSSFTPTSSLKYSTFLKELSKVLNMNLKTLHQSFIAANTKINEYLNLATIRIIKQSFDNYLMFNAIDKFSIEYKKVSNQIHPKKLTDAAGNVLNEISSTEVGLLFSDEKVADTYFFEELFYDSELEKENIQSEIREVVVFTKIPKHSIKIPVAGGKSYSPDFAYIIHFKNGAQKLHFVVETKNVGNEQGLREEEIQKTKHAEKFFSGAVEIKFKTQFNANKMVEVIKDIYRE